jgi:uncharacterized protein (DUF1501 family)
MGAGNDGLNMVVPHADPLYHDLRGDLAVPSPIHLDGEIGLHPALTFVAERYTDGQVAIIEGFGYPGTPISGILYPWPTGGQAIPGMLSARDGWVGISTGLSGRTIPSPG